MTTWAHKLRLGDFLRAGDYDAVADALDRFATGGVRERALKRGDDTSHIEEAGEIASDIRAATTQDERQEAIEYLHAWADLGGVWLG